MDILGHPNAESGQHEDSWTLQCCVRTTRRFLDTPVLCQDSPKILGHSSAVLGQ